MAKPYVLPYRLGSRSATKIAKHLNTKCVKPDGNYKPQPHHIVLNWGSAEAPPWANTQTKWMNPPAKVAVIVNKLATFNLLQQHNVSIPEFTTDINVARGWITNGDIVICRTMLRSHSGNGIVVAKTNAEVVSAPLYTKFFNRKNEYRLHIMKDPINGNAVIFDFAQKKRTVALEGQEETNPYIRSHGNGWIFARENVTLPPIVKTEAIKAFNASGLQLSCIDLGYKVTNGSCVVFELNTAIGIEGITEDSYFRAIGEYLNNQHITPAANLGATPATPTPQAAPPAPPVQAVPKKSENATVVPVPTKPVQQTPTPVAPRPPVQPNIRMTPAPAPKSQKQYNLDGVTNVTMKEVDDCTVVYGNVAGVVKKVHVMSMKNGKVTYFWQEDLE